MKKKKPSWICPIIAMVIFIACTLWIKMFDVKPIGPNGSSVGCASLNLMLLHGYNKFWYLLTEFIGYISIVIMFAMACLGLVQLIKGKSFKAVNPALYVLAGFYAVMVFFYALFEVVVINCRPILESDGSLEASYPSSHTMLSLCVLISLIYQLKYIIKKKSLQQYASIALVVLSLLAVVGRFLCGVHWFTDILGGVILSFALLLFYDAAIKVVETKFAK